ncbi:MAG: 30S ribosomal protein S12 methylthiotransferase RimO [Caldimicrobium sp.]|nr:30S ribosomal protein S12 methylthiotransferase RimO [Caldimicrobium sp.]MDW8183525.1 30S ribosomal protein S12 methylthiotransferase RimO [Caldimicrobium sp.]
MKSSKSKVSKKIYPVSLGCPKNKSDFEKLLYIFQQQGYEFTLNPEDAELLWVNTCAFIKPSIEEALEHIFELGSNKGKAQKLIVSGCLPARYGEPELKALLPEVDEFYGIESYRYFSKEEPVERVLTDNPFFAYLKISEGCNHRCSYCTIPKIRGPFRSKPMEQLLKEVENLLKIGVKEIILVGQDITSYGRDMNQRDALLRLLERISHLPYEFRIRLLYLHPLHIKEPFIENLLSIPKVVPYFDIPIQHAHPEILKRMKRGYSPEKVLSLISYIKRLNPSSSIRTSIIVGFPGEEEEEFSFLMEFLREAKFDYLGVFPFYPEEGTEAAAYQNQIPYRERQRRKREVLRQQKDITKVLLEGRIGQEEELLVLGEDLCGRPFGITKIQAPEIDGITYLKNRRNSLMPGDLIKVKIVKSGIYDLWAEPLALSG